MAQSQYVSRTDQEQRVEPVVSTIANPLPLGLSARAFTTAIIGCSYAGFILPALPSSLSLAVGAALFYGGIVQILAGMWEFRKGNTATATLFSSYGGFLLAFGVIFIPGFGIFNALNSTSALHPALGLLFLCWTIFTGVLFLGSLRTNAALLLTLALLFLAYLFLTIGQLASANSVLLAIGGWLGIVTALIGWYTALASIVNSANWTYRMPMGWIG
jgi:succinate-acetate transporter protein